jgi:plastocyanin
MRARSSFVLFVLFLCSTALFAKDVYLPIGGSANGFFTDARIFNPSYEKDITVTARYLPVHNINNENATTRTIVVPKRSMAVYDDVVKALFGTGVPPLGGIRLTSDDDFVATQRVYADLTPSGRGTLGQLVPGFDVSEAKTKGVLVLLKAGQANGRSFRTNLGGTNPNGVVANVDFELYDKTNTLAGTNTLTIQPYGVLQPGSIVDFFGQPNRDLTDAWISFESDQPVLIYGSVVDNTSTDPTFIPAYTDSGVKPVTPPPPPEPVVVTIVAHDFDFEVTQSRPIRAGDQVRFRVSQSEGSHGFRIGGPNGILFEIGSLPQGTPAERVLTLIEPGSYGFVCTNSGCGSGHFSMVGSLTVNP